MDARQDSDNLAWDRSDERWEAAIRRVRFSSTYCRIEAFAQRLLGDTATLALPMIIGGFNVLYPFRTKGSSPMANCLVRLPCPNQTTFREEKSLADAATTVCISQLTQLPVPTLHSYGVDPAIGPFIILQDLGTRRGMGEALEAPRKNPNDTPILNPNISESKLKSLYRHIAASLLQLAQPTFPRIGALVETEPGKFSVSGRPITLNMSNVVQQSNVPISIFPPEGTAFRTADDWYVALAEMQIATLIFQHNDMIFSDDDCKTKYVARQLIRRLAKQGRLSKFGFADDIWSASSEQTRTNLPAPDNDEILGAIDWEFTSAAPTQLSLDLPWWLLFDVPEMRDAGIDDWATLYERRLQTWLSTLEEAEQDMGPGSFLLSASMRESWTTGRFWLNYAARKSWAFDSIYWKYLDERFFGEREKDTPTISEL